MPVLLVVPVCNNSVGDRRTCLVALTSTPTRPYWLKEILDIHFGFGSRSITILTSHVPGFCSWSTFHRGMSSLPFQAPAICRIIERRRLSSGRHAPLDGQIDERSAASLRASNKALLSPTNMFQAPYVLHLNEATIADSSAVWTVLSS